MGRRQAEAAKRYQGHACNALGCPECVRAFYAWAQQHTNGNPRSRRGPKTARTFYECAGSVDSRVLTASP